MEQFFKLSFLGGASSIGASSTLLQVADKNILIDCGIRFRKDAPLPDLNELSGIKLDAVIVTHAHSDHTGGLPVVANSFPQTPIYMTPPTIDLVEILQKDSLALMEKGVTRDGEIPLYTEKQVQTMSELLRPLHHGKILSLGDIEISFWPASHILGASMAYFNTPSGRILFSGDYCVSPQKTVPGLSPFPLPVDMFITESTYGQRIHTDRNASINRLLQTINEIILKGGRILIPAFAIGRAQEVLLILKEAMRNKKIPQVPVFADGMVRNVCNIYSRHQNYLSKELVWECKRGHPFFNDNIQQVSFGRSRKEILEVRPSIIVASSGMLSGGPSAFYAEYLAQDERDGIIITGYQDEESPGRKLLNLASAKNNSERKMVLNGKEIDVKCHFSTYSLSAHADQLQMLNFINQINPNSVVMVHGDNESKEELSHSIANKDCFVAQDGFSISRSYKKKKSHQKVSPRVMTVTPTLIENLIEDQIPPYSMKFFSSIFFKNTPTPNQELDLAFDLEATGLLKRDDNKRHLFFKTNNPMLKDQEFIALKKINPKGKLLEYCQANNLATPQILTRSVANSYISVAQIPNYKSSDEQTHKEMKHAELLAYNQLLEKISRLEHNTDVCELPKEEIEDLIKKNIKGQCYELCQKYNQKIPLITIQPHKQGFVAKGNIIVNDEDVETRWYFAITKKNAELGAWMEIFPLLENFPVSVKALDNSNINPIGYLNELKQKNKIRDFQFNKLDEIVQGSNRNFIFDGMVFYLDDSEYKSQIHQGPNLKFCKNAVAHELIANINEKII